MLNLAFVGQQLAAAGLVAFTNGNAVGAGDGGIDEPQLVFFDVDIGASQLAMSQAQRLGFGAAEHNARKQAIAQLVVVSSAAIGDLLGLSLLLLFHDSSIVTERRRLDNQERSWNYTFMKHSYNHVLRPDALGGALPNVLGARLAASLEQRAADVSQLVIPDTTIGVIIQARRQRYPGAPERHPDYTARIVEDLQCTLGAIGQQESIGPVTRKLVLVEDDLYLGRHKRALERDHAVEFLSVPNTTNHPEALNMGVLALGDDCEMTHITQAGARLATNQAFRAGAWWIGNGEVAAYGTRLPDVSASASETALYGLSALVNRRLRQPVINPGAEFGLLAADRAFIRQEALLAQPFNTDFARGGADGAWVHEFRESRVSVPAVVYDPAASVHFTEGLGPLDLAKRVHEWRGYSGHTAWPTGA